MASKGHASSDERFSGNMNATFFHDLSGPFWVVDVFNDQGNLDLQYAIVYACVSPRDDKRQSFIFLLSRTPILSDFARDRFLRYCATSASACAVCCLFMFLLQCALVQLPAVRTCVRLHCAHTVMKGHEGHSSQVHAQSAISISNTSICHKGSFCISAQPPRAHDT